MMNALAFASESYRDTDTHAAIQRRRRYEGNAQEKAVYAVFRDIRERHGFVSGIDDDESSLMMMSERMREKREKEKERESEK